jgi:hypothetical protein
MNLIERINEHRYLYLTELSEPEDNVLRLLITEGRISDEPHGANAEGRAGIGSQTRAIIADERSAAYEVVFDQYIAYTVLNESYTVWDDDEIFEGQLFRIYSKSKFLAYVSAGTIASADYPGPFKHYGISCLNHIVQVASTVAPLITTHRRT